MSNTNPQIMNIYSHHAKVVDMIDGIKQSNFYQYCKNNGFNIEHLNDKCFTVSKDGKYMTAFPDGNIKLYATKCSVWEKFYILDNSQQITWYINNILNFHNKDYTAERMKSVIEQLNSDILQLCESVPNNIHINNIKKSIAFNLLELAQDLRKKKIIGNNSSYEETASFLLNDTNSGYDAQMAYKEFQPSFAERNTAAQFIHQNLPQLKQKVINNIYLNNQEIQQDKIKVFTYWDNDLTMPDFVKICRNSLFKYISTEKFELIILNEQNYSDWLDIDLTWLNDDGIASKAHFTDVLRLKLLAKWGGFWLDATCLLTDDLFKATEIIRRNEHFMFTYTHTRVGNWFIWSKEKNNYVLDLVAEALILWWRERKFLTNYFMTHDFIQMCYWIDEDYRKLWDKAYKYHPKNALLLFEARDKTFESISKESFIHKLSYKFDINKIHKDRTILELFK